MEMEMTHGSLSERELQAVEQLWGYQLPMDYRVFLLNNNGGVPKKLFFFFENKNKSIFLSEFFGIFKDFNKNILLKQLYAGKRVPTNTLPIGRDSVGNLILLSVKGQDRGKVYFWDHEREAGEGREPDYSNLTLIADSFDKFLKDLKDEQEAEKDFQRLIGSFHKE